MIDIHAHILHGIDDGAKDLTDAVFMAELAAEGGTDIIIATPHGNIPPSYGKAGWKGDIDLLMKRRDELERQLKRRGIHLTILMGMEIFGTAELPRKIKSGQVLSMPDEHHCMVEFDPQMPGHDCLCVIRDLTEMGRKVIVAHPERYECIQNDLETARLWRREGCEFQVNPEGILGRAMPVICRTAEDLIDGDLVDYVASDAHDPYDRTPFLGDVYEYIKRSCGSVLAKKLLRDNALELLTGGTYYSGSFNG